MKSLSLSGTLGHFYVHVIVLKLEIWHGSAGRIGKSISGFTQMLRVFRVDILNAYISVSIFA